MPETSGRALAREDQPTMNPTTLPHVMGEVVYLARMDEKPHT